MKLNKFVASLIMVVAFSGLTTSVVQAKRPDGAGQHGSPSGVISSPDPRPFQKNARLVNATVTGKSGDSLTVSLDGKSHTVDASSAKVIARFWGNLTLAEVQVNDKVSVWGTWTEATKTTIKARLIRDLSVQRRHATFLGTVKSLGSNSLVLETVKRGSQNVSYVSGPIVNRKQEPMSFSAIRVGDRIRVKGLWDSAGSTITVDTSKSRISQIKDFSLPPRPSPSPSASPLATP